MYSWILHIFLSIEQILSEDKLWQTENVHLKWCSLYFTNGQPQLDNLIERNCNTILFLVKIPDNESLESNQEAAAITLDIVLCNTVQMW